MAEAVFFDRVLETTTTTGTGTLTLAGAVTGYQTFAAVGDGNTTPMAIWEVDANGNPSGTWEVAETCTYTASGTTLTRGTFKASSTGSAINFGAGTKRVGQSLPASIANQMRKLNVAGTDANTTMAVNTRYTVDMSAWATADRTYTLPATAAVNDEVEIFVSAGNASFELIITANTGDTLAGVAGGTEWSRVFITGERVLMRCTVANATWVIDRDGRIPQKCDMELTTQADGESAATFTQPTAATSAGAWTANLNVGSVASTSNDRITIRRGGSFKTYITFRAKDGVTDAKYIGAGLFKNAGATLVLFTQIINGATTAAGVGNSIGNTRILALVADDYVVYKYRTEEGAIGAKANESVFGLSELIP